MSAVARDQAQFAQILRGNETAAHQAETSQHGQPLRIEHVGLATGHVLDEVRVDRDVGVLQVREHALPINAGTLHDHELNRLQVVPLTQLTALPDGKEVRIVGLITRIKRILTTRQQSMAFVHLEDQDSTMEVIVFPSLYRHVTEWLEPGTVVALEGVLDKNDRGMKVKATRFFPLNPAA